MRRFDCRDFEAAERAADDVCNLDSLVHIVHCAFPMVGSDDAYRVAAYAAHLAHARIARDAGSKHVAEAHDNHATALHYLLMRSPLPLGRAERSACTRVRIAFEHCPYAVQPDALLERARRVNG